MPASQIPLMKPINPLLNDDDIANTVNGFIAQSLHHQASDIHFESNQQGGRVRIRCDGLLMVLQQLDSEQSRRCCSYLKVLAKLNIAEKRLPQDGRIQWHYHDWQANIRISTIATLWG